MEPAICLGVSELVESAVCLGVSELVEPAVCLGVSELVESAVCLGVSELVEVAVCLGVSELVEVSVCPGFSLNSSNLSDLFRLPCRWVLGLQKLTCPLLKRPRAIICSLFKARCRSDDSHGCFA